MSSQDSAGAVEQVLSFDNRFTRELPADPDPENRRRQVSGACYSRVKPKRFAAPALVAYSAEAAAMLDLPERYCASDEFVQTFVGNRLLPGMDPYAMCYGGHQFGNWAGQLGDGRAINLGEVVNRDGRRWVLQLKGAGPTPYARTADGLAVLRSSIREFLCSEAMHHLGVPTTRALSVITTGEPVERDMFYDGHPQDEPGAVVCRVAPSFTRFGNFQIFAARREHGVLKRLAEYTIRVDFPHLLNGSVERVTRDTYVTWFEEVCRRTAEMIVHWQRVGFVHGVMNTDNMSILGLTIDYGPYGWLEGYDPDWTPNTTDSGGRRYRFGHQPSVALWNLVQLANAIYPLVEEAEPLEQALTGYKAEFDRLWHAMMAGKLGLTAFRESDRDLIQRLEQILQAVETDMTIFFRALARVDAGAAFAKRSPAARLEPLTDAYYAPDQLTDEYRSSIDAWLGDYVKRVRQDGLSEVERRRRMDSVNPRYVLRNYLAQLAIDRAEQGDASGVNDLLEVLRRPYHEQRGKEEFAAKRPEWARHRAGCSMLSCSS